VPESNDLLIGIYRLDADVFGVDLQFRRPDDNVDEPPGRGRMKIVPDELKTRLTPERYGDYLTDCLFVQTGLGDHFKRYRDLTQREGRTLRLRLSIDRTAADLHALRWETLRDPTDTPRRWLLSSADVPFSRFLSSTDFRPVVLNRRGALRALVAIANPTDLDQYHPGGQDPAEVDVPGELARVSRALGVDPARPWKIPFRLLASLTGAEAVGKPTAADLIAELQKGVDVLYLVCHGALLPHGPEGALRPSLWLEDAATGRAEVVPGDDLANAVRDLVERPRLVVLASCQSAGAVRVPKLPVTRTRDRGALAPLGPRLAAAGVPAVVAMQGNVLMDSAARFLSTFFEQIQGHGLVDLAAAVARNRIVRPRDGWVPAVFSRLRTGRIWYEPRLSRRAPEWTWPGLLESVKQARCNPILGPGLIEPLVGPQREIAQRWADTYHFPMSPHDREDLTQVAQYLATMKGQKYMRSAFLDQIKAEVLRREPSLVGKEAALVVRQAGALLRARGGDEDVHRMLARLDVPIYVTTTPDNLMADALAEAGKHPLVEFFRWNRKTDEVRSVFDSEPSYVPSRDRPWSTTSSGRSTTRSRW
jgi:hypothetical protein